LVIFCSAVSGLVLVRRLFVYLCLSQNWKKELLKNKLYALLLVIIGALSILIEYDGTFFIFALMIGLPLFFAKENWIM